jgi:hypothetical protein
MQTAPQYLPPPVYRPNPVPTDSEPEKADCARKWDWLKQVKYPYFWAYESEPWPETPEYDLGSRPWIYP